MFGREIFDSQSVHKEMGNQTYRLVNSLDDQFQIIHLDSFHVFKNHKHVSPCDLNSCDIAFIALA